MLGVVTGSNEFRDAVMSGLLVGVIDFLSKLPDSVPTVSSAWLALRSGVIVGITFYLANKGIKAVSKPVEK